MHSSSSGNNHDLIAEGEPLITAQAAAKDIAFGSIAGMVAEIFEYPFDLAKVRLQAQLLTPASSQIVRFNGPLDCLTQTWREEGVRGLYRGLPAPIVGAMAETAALFLAYTSFQNTIRNFSASPRNTPLTMPQLSLAAGGAGFVTSFVLTPIELVKCKMQVQMMNFQPSTPPAAPWRIPTRPIPFSSIVSPTSSINRAQNITSSSYLSSKPPQQEPRHSGRSNLHDIAYNKSNASTLPPPAAVTRPPGPISLIRSIVDTYGVRGLWLGHTGTVLRQTGGGAAWFASKEWVARQLIERRTHIDANKVIMSPLAWESAVSGAIAGAVGALIFYPADTVKSAIQTEDELRPRKTKGLHVKSTFLGTFKRMYVKHGVRGLYAGCGMTVARAVPSSGIIFVVYDGLRAWFA